MNNTRYIKMTYESLIALLQGKDLHLQYIDADAGAMRQIVIKPPFEGRFLTFEEIWQLESDAGYAALKVAEEMPPHIQAADDSA